MNGTTRLCKAGLSPWQLAAYTVAGVAVGALLIFLPVQYVLVAAAGTFVLAVTAARPEIGILIITVLISSIVFEESLPLIPIGVGSLHISDILLLFMLGVMVYKRVTGRTAAFVRTPLDLSIALFYASAIMAAYISIVHYGKNFNDVVRILRYVTYYLLFYIITNEITEKRQVVFLIKGLLLIAGIVTVTMVAQLMIGESVQLMPGRIEGAETFGQEYETLRILPPGQTLLFIAFITAICITVFRQGKSLITSGSFYLVALFGAGVVLTYNRSYWVAALLAVCVLMLLAGTGQKKRLAALLAVAVVSAGLLAAFAAYSGTGGRTLEAVSERFGSLFAGKTLTESSSLDDRAIENSYAIRQIESHPVLGIGLGNDYRPEIPGLENNLTFYVHNVYLWITTDMGLPGLLLFLWFYIGFLWRAFRHRNNIEDDYLRSAVVGFMLSGAGIALMAFVNPVFMQWFSIVVIAVMMGLTEAIIRINGNELAGSPDGSVAANG